MRARTTSIFIDARTQFLQIVQRREGNRIPSREMFFCMQGIIHMHAGGMSVMDWTEDEMSENPGVGVAAPCHHGTGETLPGTRGAEAPMWRRLGAKCAAGVRPWQGGPAEPAPYASGMDKPCPGARCSEAATWRHKARTVPQRTVQMKSGRRRHGSGRVSALDTFIVLFFGITVRK